jgi:hypothetical protein
VFAVYIPPQAAGLLVDPAGEVLPVALERRHDVELLAAAAATGLDRAAVDHERRPIEARHGHHAAGHVLVAARQGDVGVVPLGRHDRLDGVGDEVAGLEGVAHALGPHRDAVGDADRVEAHSHEARGQHPVLDLRGQVVQVHVAGVAFEPDVRDPHLGLVHVLLAKARGVEHRLGGPLGLRLGDPRADSIQFFGHRSLPE